MVHNHIFSVEFVWFYHFACAYKEKVYWCSWSSFYHSCYLWPTIIEPYYTTWHVATLMSFSNYIQSLPFLLYFFVILHSYLLRQRILVFIFLYLSESHQRIFAKHFHLLNGFSCSAPEEQVHSWQFLKGNTRKR